MEVRLNACHMSTSIVIMVNVNNLEGRALRDLVSKYLCEVRIVSLYSCTHYHLYATSYTFFFKPVRLKC